MLEENQAGIFIMQEGKKNWRLVAGGEVHICTYMCVYTQSRRACIVLKYKNSVF